MDTNAPVARDAQNQTTATQSGDSVIPVQGGKQNTALISDDQSQALPQQPPVVKKILSQQPSKTQISITGGGIEEGASMIVAENPDADEDDEDELRVAPQEKKNLGVMGQGGDVEDQDDQQVVGLHGSADIQDQTAEIAPAIPEVVTSSPEVEKLVELTPPDRPKLSEEVKRIGVTHSGPGIIDPGPSGLPAPKIPISIEQVLTEEEKIKSNRLHTSKYWLLEKIKYIWRKVNPKIVTDLKKQPTQQVSAAKKLPVKTGTAVTNPVPATMIKKQNPGATPPVKISTVIADPTQTTESTQAD